jgi:anaerobic dimethyl sulfoxide reductase subunit C (anchor subunit)
MGAEWSLVAFTLTGQLALGVYLFIGGPLYLFGEMSGFPGGPTRLAVALAVLGLLAAATALSFFHLHHPARAYKVFSNLGTSWLSREILFEFLFIGLAGLLGFCEWRGIGSPNLTRALFVIGGLAGGLFVLAMSRIYMLPAVQAWNNLHTPLSFGLTSLVLGSMAGAAVFGRLADPPPFFRALIVTALFSVGASTINVFLLAPGRGLFGPKPDPALRPRFREPGLVHGARIFLLLAGLLLIAAAGGGPVSSAAARTVALLAAFGLVAAAEIRGRVLFYGLSGRRS